MPEELSDTLKIGRLEDKFNLYEPMFASLQGIVSIPNQITKIQEELQLLRESRIKVREQLVTLFKSQDRVYKDMVKSLERQTRLMEKEIKECPIIEIVSKVTVLEREMDIVTVLDDRVEKAERAIESFKSKGWDLLLRIIPWIIAFVASTYAVVNN